MADEFVKLPKKKPSNNYHALYYEASYFLHAALVLKEKTYFTSLKDVTKQEMDLSIGMQYASQVNHAYAFELFIKCIMVIENGEYFSGHHLLGLFKKLNQTTQRKIQDIFKKEYRVIRRHKLYFGIMEEVEFIDLITEAEEAFVDLRYHFDRKGNPPPYDLWDSINCLKVYILEVKPELKANQP